MKYGLLFGTATVLPATSAMIHGGWYYVLFWPALSFGIVALGYFHFGPRVFGKSQRGIISPTHQLLLLPYLIYLWSVWHTVRLVKRESARTGTGVAPNTGGGWVNGRGDDTMVMLRAYRHLADFFTAFDWWTHQPNNNMVEQRFPCLARKGKRYVIYLPSGGHATIFFALLSRCAHGQRSGCAQVRAKNMTGKTSYCTCGKAGKPRPRCSIFGYNTTDRSVTRHGVGGKRAPNRYLTRTVLVVPARSQRGPPDTMCVGQFGCTSRLITRSCLLRFTFHLDVQLGGWHWLRSRLSCWLMSAHSRDHSANANRHLGILTIQASPPWWFRHVVVNNLGNDRWFGGLYQVTMIFIRRRLPSV